MDLIFGIIAAFVCGVMVGGAMANHANDGVVREVSRTWERTTREIEDKWRTAYKELSDKIADDKRNG